MRARSPDERSYETVSGPRASRWSDPDFLIQIGLCALVTIFFASTAILATLYATQIAARDVENAKSYVPSSNAAPSRPADAACEDHALRFEPLDTTKHCLVVESDGIYAIHDVECLHACDAARKVDYVNAGRHVSLAALRGRKLVGSTGGTHQPPMYASWWTIDDNGNTCEQGQSLTTGTGCWCSASGGERGSIAGHCTTTPAVIVTPSEGCALLPLNENTNQKRGRGWFCLGTDQEVAPIAAGQAQVPPDNIDGVLQMSASCSTYSVIAKATSDEGVKGCWCDHSASYGASLTVDTSNRGAVYCYSGSSSNTYTKTSITCADPTETPTAVGQKNTIRVGWICGTPTSCTATSITTMTTQPTDGCGTSNAGTLSGITLSNVPTDAYQCQLSATVTPTSWNNLAPQTSSQKAVTTTATLAKKYWACIDADEDPALEGDGVYLINFRISQTTSNPLPTPGTIFPNAYCNMNCAPAPGS